nr:hypothetical protein [Puia dinghuensis]
MSAPLRRPDDKNPIPGLQPIVHPLRTGHHHLIDGNSYSVRLHDLQKREHIGDSAAIR